MEIEQSFIFYGHYPVDGIKKILEENNLSWTDFEIRQKACTDMKNTQTIPIIFDEAFFSTNFTPVYHKNYKFFQQEIEKISEVLKNKTNGNGYLLRAILTKLFAGKDIPEHIDVANQTFKLSKRIHIPIVTNPDCIFTVGDESINMKEGEIWEMNNDKKVHSVINGGTEDRIHLIMDWCEKTPDMVEGSQIRVN